MEQRNSPRFPYLPALDGLRALALVAVLLAHAGFAWAKGGHLGVTSFFTLSGFLITSLLLGERDRIGRIRLGAFWGRRARRLVPALLLTVAFIALYAAANFKRQPDSLLGDAASGLIWFANWRFIIDGRSYGDAFSDPSPFQHLWSLAIEEQLYLFLPVLVVLLARRRRWPLAVAVVGGIVGSTIAAAALHTPGDAPLRAYFGTDARIAEPLVGALLALIFWTPRGLRRLPQVGAVTADIAALGALGGLVFLFTQLDDHATRLYEGGFLLAAVLTAIVLVAATHPRTVTANLLARPSLVALGRISYGAYLFHWPVYLWVSKHNTGIEHEGQLLLARVALTLTLAALSYHLVEVPIRFGYVRRSVTLPAWATSAAGLLALFALIPSLLPSATDGLIPTNNQPRPPPVAPQAQPTAPPPSANPAQGRVMQAQSQLASATGPAQQRQGDGTGGPDPVLGGAPQQSGPPPAPPDDRLRVAVVGDSMAYGLGRGLEVWAEERGDVVVYNVGIGRCPLSREGERRYPGHPAEPVPYECGWWSDPYSERSSYVRSFDPDVVVIQDGFDELFDRRIPSWQDFRHPGDAVFDTWLRDEYRQLLATLGEDRTTSFVVTNAVCADWTRYDGWDDMTDADQRVSSLNTTVYQALSGVQTTVADLFERICPNGQYSDSVEGYEGGRPDGFHLSQEARIALARNWLGPIILDRAQATGAGGDDIIPLPGG